MTAAIVYPGCNLIKDIEVYNIDYDDDGKENAIIDECVVWYEYEFFCNKIVSTWGKYTSWRKAVPITPERLMIGPFQCIGFLLMFGCFRKGLSPEVDITVVQRSFCGISRTIKDSTSSQNMFSKNETWTDHLHNVSVHMHDYTGPASRISSKVNKCEQTFTLQVEDSSTQTDFTVTCNTKPERVDVGIQCNKPDIAVEDIKDNDYEVQFYTGIPTFMILMLLFNTIKVKAQNGKAKIRVLGKSTS
ncbi:hypothetical protein CHS0354_009125 [Potamilus streckersoni]|uniref:Uncharacterized protein n=1 Tax=Potamilus streckersoni TaxID=2493646 RepID=A0AAE0SS74_9BIVA|nr:hypothetical protein CHS0354_009125 [Potamilus streckersoni]